jgi:hypothetical protein
VLWTPGGYYDCSPGAEDLIGWHMNRGKDQAADFFPASRFWSTFYRPDVIDQVLDTLDEGEAVRQANEAAGRLQAQSLESLLPPMVTILSPGNGTHVSQPTVTLRVSARHPRGRAIDEVWAAVDGRAVGTRGIQVKSAEGATVLEVPVPRQDCVVSVFARSGSAISDAASVRLVWAVPRETEVAQEPAFVAKPKLYSVGGGRGQVRPERPEPGLCRQGCPGCGCGVQGPGGPFVSRRGDQGADG